MEELIKRPPRLEGQIAAPSDKSISHRALIFNAIAKGTAHVSNLSASADVTSTMRCLRALGVRIEAEKDPEGKQGWYQVQGAGAAGLSEPPDVLDAGNSGTTTRLLSGVLAAQPFLSIITGDSSLRSRPMDRVVKPLRQMGAEITGRKGGSLAPLVIHGTSLHGIEHTLPVASAQVKSSLLLAGLYAQGETVLHQPAQSRDHTERMLRAMGAHLVEDGLTIIVRPSELTALDIEVPGDISSAAFWLVAGACHPQASVTVTNVGVNPSRTGILDVLQQMGASITLRNHRTQGGEPVADIQVRSSQLQAVEVGGDLIPRMIDELPLLAVAACFAKGSTVIRDAQELRVKETDRISTTVQELSKLGARVEERPDGMVIHGTGKLSGARCRSHGDHRLAMSLAIAGLLASGETVVQGAQAAKVSYPEFWQHLRVIASPRRNS